MSDAMSTIPPQWAVLEANTVVGEKRSGPRRFWTGRESMLLREHFPKGGVAATLPHLPGRTAKAIYQYARVLGLQAPGSPAERRRQPYATSDHIDAAIRRVYQKAPTKGDIAKLAQSVMRPRWWVGKRATQLGLMVPRFRAVPWSEAECAVVRGMTGKTPAAVQRALKARGYVRSESAVAVQMRRLGVTRRDDNPDLFTASSLAEAMGVDSHVVTAWVARGLLRAKPLGGRTSAWTIRRRDVREFIVGNVAAVDIRKCDKFWLVELLAGPPA